MSTNDKILEEITRRVLELDNKNGASVRHTEKLEDHISALDEVTRLPRREIEGVAYEVKRQYETRAGKKRIYSALAVVLLTLIAGAGAYVALLTSEGPADAPSFADQTTPSQGAGLAPQNSPVSARIQQMYMQQAAAAQVVSSLSALKVMMLEYHAMQGGYPENFADIGLKAEEMHDGRYIKQVHLLPKGVILADLSDFFGADKQLALVPEEIMGGTQVKWRCISSLDEKVFSQPRSYDFCESNAALLEKMRQAEKLRLKN